MRARGRRTGQVQTVPAPIGGWNARDALDLMQVTDAVQMDNFFPGLSYVSLRNGHVGHATGLGAAVETLMPYAGGARARLFAVAGGVIHDVTDVGTVEAPVLSGLGANRWQHVNFGSSGGNFLWICNGVDEPRCYDGSTWTQPGLTGFGYGGLAGFDVIDIASVTVFKRRLMFCLKDSLTFAYLPVESIAGPVQAFELAPLFKRGGRLLAIGSWTLDAGDGADDWAVFVTDQGEIAAYQGIDPSDANNWSLVGIFHMGRPIGRDCLLKLGSDLILITEEGYIPISSIMSGGQTAVKSAISDKIARAVRDQARINAHRDGWQAVLHARGGFALFNLPTGDRYAEQHVVNIATGAWCRFTGLHAACWAGHGGDLFFGSFDGTVHRADTGADDNGADIQGVAKTSYIYFGGRGALKRFSLIRPVLSGDGAVSTAVSIATDFNAGAVSEVTSATAAGTPWGAPWGHPWAAQATPITDWRGIEGVGFNAAIRLRTAGTTPNVRWHATDLRFETGDGI